MMDKLISQQAAIDALKELTANGTNKGMVFGEDAVHRIEMLPSVQPKQNEMVKEIRRWINSGNRGNADYFIVDRIEEIINAYEIN